MSLPVATARGRAAPVSRLDLALVVVALAAFAATHLSIPDPHFLIVATCEDSFRLSDLFAGAPSLVIAFLVALRIASGHRGGIASRAIYVIAALAVALVLTFLVQLRGLDGPEYLANAISHAALLALVLVRAVARR